MEDGLLELDHPRMREQARVGLDHLDALREMLEHAQGAFEREVRKAAKALIGSAREARASWQTAHRLVAAGRTAQVHAQRERFLSGLRAQADLLRRVHEAARLLGKSLPEADALLDEIADLDRLHAKLSSRWVASDPESLEYLVAEEMTPPAAKLEAITAKHGPPQAWYDEE